MMRETFTLVHLSKTRYESMLDTQLFFPEQFHVKFMTLVGQPALFFMRQPMMAQKRLEDVLAMNQYRVLRTIDLGLSRDQVATTFKSIFSNCIPFADFILAEMRLKMIISGKMGLNSFNVKFPR
jgi:hypothetical protein